MPNAFKLRLVPNQMIVALLLPETGPRKPEYPVRLPGAESLQGLGQLGKVDAGAQKYMNVIRHNDEGVESEVPEHVCAVPDNFHHHAGDGGLMEIEGAGTRLLQQAVHCNERFSGGKGVLRKCAIRWKAVVEAPRQEDRLIGLIEMGEPAAVESHGVIVEGGLVSSPGEEADREVGCGPGGAPYIFFVLPFESSIW